MRLEHLALVGNCQFSALIENSGRVVWCCLPRFDAEPTFGHLLDADGGFFSVAPANGQAGVQRYIENTNVVETTFEDSNGSFRVVDFAPRFILNDRVFRPTQLVRIVEPLRGTPVVRVQCEPVVGWAKARSPSIRGSNHLAFQGFAAPLRLTSDIAPTYLEGEPFTLTERRYLVLTWGAPIEEPLAPLCDGFLEQTIRYWRRWVKHCNIPPMYQREVIRSALALKLHCFEDTGAIVAAMTTSIPEAPGSGRNWDYRYCWLRDAYYVLGALRLLGHFEEREHFIQYLLNIAASAPGLELRPLYRIDGKSDLSEAELGDWGGFEGDRPVRVGNGAALHKQHDVFGEMVLALAPIYMDDRFTQERSPTTLRLIEDLARKGIEVAGTPDAGIWEFRKAWEPQTFSSLMCWAGADRMARISEHHCHSLKSQFESAADHIRAQIVSRAWREDRRSFVASYDGRELDAALLQMAPLRFLPGNDQRLIEMVDAIGGELGHQGWLFRYRSDDGLGSPEVAFMICTFWLIEALALTGRSAQARNALEHVRSAMSPLGLLSEDYSTAGNRMWGNFPQAYSHVGLIHAAFSASPGWSDWL